jgi:Holliday junction resolvase RusA-like endonuclease
VGEVRRLRIVTHGAPATQGSKKGFIRGRKVVLVEMDAKLPAWRAAVEAAARLAAGPAWVTIDGAVKVTGEVRLLKPKTTKYPDHPAGPPDTDKLQRAIGDALTKSRVIADDARIVHWDIRKVWAEGLPGMDIEIAEIGGSDAPKNPGI